MVTARKTKNAAQARNLCTSSLLFLVLLSGCEDSTPKPTPPAPSQKSLESEEYASLHQELRSAKLQFGDFNKAGNHTANTPVAQRIVKLSIQLKGQEHPDTSAASIDLGTILLLQGRYKEALDSYGQALARLEESANPNQTDLARLYGNMGLAHAELAQFDDAERFNHRATEAHQNNRQINKKDYAVLLKNIKVIPARRERVPLAAKIEKLREAKEYTALIPVAARYLDLTKQVRGENHPDTIVALYILGDAYSGDNQHEKALELYKLGQEKTDNAVIPGLAGPVHGWTNLGFTYWKLGNHEAALMNYQKALDFWDSSVNPDYSELAKLLRNVSMVYDDLRDSVKVAFHRERALAIYENILGPTHPELAIYLHDAGLANLEIDQAEKSQEQFKRALDIWESSLDAEHANVALALYGLGRALVKDEPEEAQHLLKRAAKIWESRHSPDAAKALRTLGTLYAEKKEYEKTEQVLRQAEQILKDASEAATDPKQQAEVGKRSKDIEIDLILLRYLQQKDKQALQLIREKNLQSEAAIVLGQLAIQHALAGNPELTALWKNRTLEIWGQEPNSAQVSFYLALSQIKREQEQTKEEVRLLQKALKMAKELGEKKQEAPPDMPVIFNRLGAIKMSEQDFPSAKQLFFQALELSQRSPGAPELEVISRTNLGQALHQCGEYGEAIKQHQQVLKLAEKLQLGTFQRGFSQNEIGLAYLALKEYAQAEELFIKTMESWAAEFGEQHQFLLPVYENLSDTYMQQKNPRKPRYSPKSSWGCCRNYLMKSTLQFRRLWRELKNWRKRSQKAQPNEYPLENTPYVFYPSSFLTGASEAISKAIVALIVTAPSLELGMLMYKIVPPTGRY